MTKKKDTLSLVVAIVFSVMVVIVASCIASRFESGDTIRVRRGDSFEIVLEADAVAGYSWDVDLKDVYVELVGKKYLLDSDLEEGEGTGKEIFTLRALRVGSTTVTFYYRLLLEEEELFLDKKSYKVKII